MQKLLLLTICCLVAFAAGAATMQQPTITTRAFDVRNGNGVVDAGTTYPQAIVVVFKDKASKDEMVDAFAAQYGYQATVPDPQNPNGPQIANPVSKSQFMNRQIMLYLRDIYKAANIEAAAKTSRKAAEDAADAKMPPN